MPGHIPNLLPPMSDLPVPESEPGIFDGEYPEFERHCRENGMNSWSASSLAEFLGYKDFKAFSTGPLNRAQQVCLSSDISVADHFKQESCVGEDGRTYTDLRLSRFACYLCAMNGDPKKLQVAQAQAYFASLADSCRNYIEETEQIERVLIRDEISDGEKSLSAEAKAAGVHDYALFKNAGYRGLYNMNLSRLKQLKRTPKGRSPLDFMGKTELAANLFRITQTSEKIKNDGIRGQGALEKTAEKVGKTVRDAMHTISGTRPENLAPEGDINKVKSGLKNTGRVFLKIPPKVIDEPAAGEEEPTA